MSTKSTKEPADNLHGEQDAHARFPINENPGGVYDERHKAPAGDPSDPRGEYDPQTTPMGDSSDPRDSEKKLSADELKDKESKADDSEKTEPAKEEKNGLYSGKEEPGRFSVTRLRVNPSRRGIVGIAVAVAVVLGGAGIFSVVQGPLQFIHVSQLLQKYFLRSNEDFGNDRSMRTFLYAVSGKSETGRLGIVSNKYADKMEKRMLEKNGVRPIYNNNANGRIAGYEIVDEGKARQSGFLRSVQSEVPNAEVKLANAVDSGPGLRGAKGATLNPNARILHFPAGTKAKYIRASTKAATKAVGLNRISTAVASRVSIKRVGAKLHYLNGLKEKRDANAKSKEEVTRSREEFERTFGEKRQEEINNGVQKPTLSGKAKELNDQINEKTKGKSKAAAKLIRTSAIKGAGPAAVVGLLCSANDIGNSAEEAKFTNNVLPLMRNFWYFTSVGEQAKSGDQISLDELSVLQKTLYDKETGTHVLDAAPLRAEGGKSATGPDIPVEARVSSLSGKPDAFEAISAVLDFGIEIRFFPDIKLSQGCTVIDAISSLPGISQFSDIVGKGIDTLLSTIGTSTDDLMNGLISVINGESVDVNAKGGEAGALLAVGGKLAGIDQGITMGASQLSSAESAQLKEEQRLADVKENQTESLFTRYADLYNPTSLASTTLTKTTVSSDQVISKITNPLSSVGSMFSGIYSSIEGKSLAAPASYDYGIADYGYSIGDQDDDRFADPYENARIIEDEANDGKILNDMNDKYSKCFGIKVTADDAGVHIESSQVNILKLEKDDEFKDCRKYANDSTSPEGELFTRYRFYIADAMSALSLACYEGDDEASCSELTGEETTEAPVEAGVAIEPPDTINGYTLTANEKKHLKYIKENVLSKLEGSASKKAQTAAESAWWALREAVLDVGKPPDVENVFGYSNCGNTHVGVIASCSASAWQVGIGAIQVPGNTGNARSTALRLNNGLTEKEILANISTLAGYEEGSAKYNQIVNSTGILRQSLFLRDPATGITLVNPIVKAECLGSTLEPWCKTIIGERGPITSSPENISKAITEIEAYFSATDGGSSATIGDVSGSSVGVPCATGTKDLGTQDGYSNGSLVKIRICAVSNLPSSGEESNNGYGVTGAGGKAVVNSKVSDAFYKLVEAAKQDGITLTASSSFRTMSHQQSLCAGNDKCASGDYTFVAKPGTSNHQLGVAVDFNLGLPIDSDYCINVNGKCTAKGKPAWEWMDKNAGRFGLKQYVNEFWHFSPTGN